MKKMNKLEYLLQKVKKISKSEIIIIERNNKRFFNFDIGSYSYRVEQDFEVIFFLYKSYGGWQSYSKGEDVEDIYRDIKEFTGILSNMIWRNPIWDCCVKNNKLKSDWTKQYGNFLKKKKKA